MQNTTCRWSWKPFQISDEMEKFLSTISPKVQWGKYNIPNPTLCPDERMRRRLAFRNERTLYHRKCEVTGNQVISIYSPERGFTVLSQKAWWGDQWDAKKYAREFDFLRKFNDQFVELLFDVPKMNLVQQGDSINADYCNCVSNNKNSYLIFNSDWNEECSYGSFLSHCKNSYDCLAVYLSENCFECIDCAHCYECFFCQDVKNSSQIYYSMDCQNSRNCFACIGLRDKKDGYYVLNQKVEKDTFETLLKETKKQEECFKFFEWLTKNTPRKFSEILMSENSTGCYLEQVKNSTGCWDCIELENCHYCNNFMFAKNCFDVSYYGVTKTNEFIYECEWVWHGVYDTKFCKLLWGETKNMMYCYECFNCENCFWCTGLKSQRYCILNKQYTKEKYEKLVWKIINHMQKTGEWGEFFDPKVSPFAYNETVARDFFPISQQEALHMWYNWREETNRSSYIGTPYIPVSISQYNEKIVSQEQAEKNISECLAWVMECRETKKNFKITKSELFFYIHYHIEIPRLHPDERYKKRLAKRLPRKLWDRTCYHCWVIISTTYSPDRPEIVYCESCYNKTI